MYKKILISYLLTLVFALPLSGFGQIITTFAGDSTQGYSGDGGTATAAELFAPYGVALDAVGNLYIADNGNNRIRMVNTLGIISTVAGNGIGGYSGDGAAATTAELNQPQGVALDAAGNVYIADTQNRRVRKVNTAGVISTYAGNGTNAYAGDGGPATAAELEYPVGVACDATGNLYIADYYNNRIRKVNTAGIISTIAGNGTAGFSGDGGQATASVIHEPAGIVFDTAGNLYIADVGNAIIRKVSTSGIMSTVAGNVGFGFSGDGGPATAAELADPSGVALDAAGNLYIADYYNNRIRKVNTAGIISTYAGTTVPPVYSGDGGPATAAGLSAMGVALDTAGNLYIADSGSRIRKVSAGSGAGIEQLRIKNDELRIYPNPTSGVFNLTISQFDNEKINSVEVYNTIGECVKQFRIQNSEFRMDVSDLSEGIYFYKVTNCETHQVGEGKIILLK
ncbi:MAG: NHL domain-containing protein [Bacteroidia bacterium]